MINIFLVTEETGTQQETTLKWKNMRNCSRDEVSHSSQDQKEDKNDFSWIKKYMHGHIS